MLAELDSTGRFDLRRFWVRRARRLLPAALAVLAVLSVTRLLTDTLSGTSGGDITAAALDVANWHFLASGMSYAELSTGPSAVLHFWSLAIEEQFYLVIAVVAVVVARRSTRPVRTMGLTAAVAAAASFLLPAAAAAVGRPMGIDRVYYGTDTRAGELMVGVVIAAVLVGASRRRRMLVHGRLAAALGLAGLARHARPVGTRHAGVGDVAPGPAPPHRALLVAPRHRRDGALRTRGRRGPPRRTAAARADQLRRVPDPLAGHRDRRSADGRSVAAPRPRHRRRDAGTGPAERHHPRAARTTQPLPLRQVGAAAMVALVVIAATTSLGGRRTASAGLLADLQRHDQGDSCRAGGR